MIEDKNMMPHYHVRVSDEMRRDLTMWATFLQDQSAYCRSFMDFSTTLKPEDIHFVMDASKNPSLGFRGHCGAQGMQARWSGLIESYNPSFEYLELLALVAGILAWIHLFENRRVILYTDNKSVFFMINKTSRGCKNCMVLIRKLVMHCLKHNIRVYARHLKSKKNGIADSLSRFQSQRFKRLTRKKGLKMDKVQTLVPEEIWPFSKIWI